MTYKNSPKEESSVKEKTKVEEPPLYKVLLHNDDYTPMDYVVYVLKHFFNCSDEQAVKIMYLVHNTGIGICGTFTKEIAETKVYLVLKHARDNQHPLKCTMEVES